ICGMPARSLAVSNATHDSTASNLLPSIVTVLRYGCAAMSVSSSALVAHLHVAEMLLAQRRLQVQHQHVVQRWRQPHEGLLLVALAQVHSLREIFVVGRITTADPALEAVAAQRVLV